jgi:beta-lactamase class D
LRFSIYAFSLFYIHLSLQFINSAIIFPNIYKNLEKKMKYVYLVGALFNISFNSCAAREEQTIVSHQPTFNMIIDYNVEGKPTQYKNGDYTTLFPPCSSFKVILALAAIREGIVTSAQIPEVDFGTSSHNGRWQGKHTPRTWAMVSCVPYSRYLTQRLGIQKIHELLKKLSYGNQNFSGKSTDSRCSDKEPLEGAWLDSSLLISVEEQVKVMRMIAAGEFARQDQEESESRLIREIFNQDFIEGLNFPNG